MQRGRGWNWVMELQHCNGVTDPAEGDRAVREIETAGGFANFQKIDLRDLTGINAKSPISPHLRHALDRS